MVLCSAAYTEVLLVGNILQHTHSCFFIEQEIESQMRAFLRVNLIRYMYWQDIPALQVVLVEIQK